MNLPLTKHICAYLDVLGGAELFKNADPEASTNFVNLILEFERRLNGMKKDGSPIVKTFTDNVFAAVPLNDTGKFTTSDQIGYFLSEVVTQLQQMFWLCELPFRGAITIGDLYITDKIIFGPAVVRAVELEKNAKFPRVLLDDNVLNSIPNVPLAKETLVYEAADGIASLNYLGLAPWHFKEHRRIVDRKLFEFKGNTSVQEKYHWLLSYQQDIEDRVYALGLAPSPNRAV